MAPEIKNDERLGNGQNETINLATNQRKVMVAGEKTNTTCELHANDGN